jgi:hypothetical protein
LVWGIVFADKLHGGEQRHAKARQDHPLLSISTVHLELFIRVLVGPLDFAGLFHLLRLGQWEQKQTTIYRLFCRLPLPPAWRRFMQLDAYAAAACTYPSGLSRSALQVIE